MRFESKLNLLRKQFVSDRMSLRILHYQSKMKRWDLPTVNAPIVGIIRHLLNQMTNDLMPMEIEIDGMRSSSANGALKDIDIESFGQV